MDDQIKQIAARLRGLRDVLNISEEEMAASCQVSLESYKALETGDVDISVSLLETISRQYGIALDVLMFGEEPRMNNYYLTRKGAGISIERVKAYKYQALASGFRGRMADPFIVTVEPKGDDVPLNINTHKGQEFNMVLEGRMLLRINKKDLILGEGDSIYFNSAQPHGMKALDGQTVRFLAVVIQG
jgi:transcriptional regulator with XRE-family HTH domain